VVEGRAGRADLVHRRDLVHLEAVRHRVLALLPTASDRRKALVRRKVEIARRATVRHGRRVAVTEDQAVIDAAAGGGLVAGRAG
jgi:hypothetical protein